jgi:hypothetical protein
VIDLEEKSQEYEVSKKKYEERQKEREQLAHTYHELKNMQL